MTLFNVRRKRLKIEYHPNHLICYFMRQEDYLIIMMIIEQLKYVVGVVGGDRMCLLLMRRRRFVRLELIKVKVGVVVGVDNNDIFNRNKKQY